VVRRAHPEIHLKKDISATSPLFGSTQRKMRKMKKPKTWEHPNEGAAIGFST
jgi:hypothetical protein